ncbi:MAG: S-layer homology domain-containing protein, partial [Acidobacteria bacterium]|nr:S-layer homology domain-containing protein [Acidobacteriota bacterium]
PQLASAWQDARLSFGDVRPGHALAVPISRAVASGVLQPLEGQTFGTSQPMTGQEAITAVDRLAAIAQGAGLGPAVGASIGAPR